MKKALLLLLVLALSRTAPAQFATEWIQNKAYWGDGKAEFSIYEAKITRYGQQHPAEVIHIFVREPFDPKQRVKPDDWRKPGTINVLKLNQILHVRTGIYVYQQMHSNFWRLDGRLVKFSLTSNDSCGNTFKLGEETPAGNALRYRYQTYWDGMAGGEEKIAAPVDGYFYDELPMRVRTIDFSKASGQFDIALAPTMIHSKKGSFQFQPATVSFETKPAEKTVVVTVKHAGGTDVFTLGEAFPRLLLRWQQFDGGDLELKRALKLPYWEFHNLGDREKALADPALRLF